MQVIKNPDAPRMLPVAAFSLALVCVGFLWTGEIAGRVPQQMPTAEVQDGFLQWPLPPTAQAYADIDDRRMQ